MWLAGCGRIGFDTGIDSNNALDTLQDSIVVDGTAAIPNLVAYYSFDTDPSTGVVACSNPAFDATCAAATCPTFTNGHRNGAGLFRDQFARVDAQLVGNAPYSVSLWARFDNAAVAPSLIAKPSSPTNSSNVLSIGLDNGYRWFYETTPDLQAIEYLDGTIAVTGRWYHVVATWDGTTKSLYIDGVLVGSGAATVANSNEALYLGTDVDNGSPIYGHDGPLDEVRIYSRALTLAEVQQLSAE